MKKELIFLSAMLLLGGSGCEWTKSPQQPVQQETSVQQQVQSPWELAFDLPEGWRYGGDADWTSQVPAEKPVQKTDDHVFLVNTSRKFYETGGAAPEWSNHSDAANYTNAIALKISPYDVVEKNEDFLKKKIKVTDYLFKGKAGEDCEVAAPECLLPGTADVEYYISLPGSLYTVTVYTNKNDQQTFSMIEQILTTAKEVK